MILASPDAAWAHGLEVLLGAEPADGSRLAQAPKHVVVRFKAELETKSSELRVFDAEGRQVDAGDGGVDLEDPDHASLKVSLPSLLPGSYSVQWRAVIFDDGDIVESRSSFTVGPEKTARSDWRPRPEGLERK